MATLTPAATTTTVPLTSQVGGHAGVLASEDGSLVIKPCLPLERDFYQTLTTNEGFATLRDFVPKFFGTLKLEGTVKGSAAEALGEEKTEELVGVGKDKSSRSTMFFLSSFEVKVQFVLSEETSF